MSDRATTDSGRSPKSAASLLTVPARLFGAWRRAVGGIALLLVRVARLAKTVGREWAAQWSRTRVYHATSTLPWPPDADVRETAAAVGARAFVFGLVAMAIVTASSRGLWLPGAITVMSEVLWAAARFIIIALLMRGGAISRARLSIAFLAGLLPYALGVTWVLRLGALVASGVLTWRGLQGAGVDSRDARIAVGWSFGGQASVIASGWLVRAVLALLAGV